MPPARKAAALAKKAASPAKRAAAPPKKALSAKPVPQTTFTMKQIAAELAESYDLPKKQAEAILSDLVTATTRHLKKGEKVRLTGLGILQVRARPILLHGSRKQTDLSLPSLRLCATNVARPTKPQHAVHHRNGNGYLGHSAVISAKPQPIADHLFVSTDRRLDFGTRVIARSLLPWHPAVRCNRLQMVIPLRWCAL